MLLLSWNKSKETRQERTAKKQGRSQKETKEQGRTKEKKQEKERDKSEKEKWMKPRRKKGRHWEINKNNPFSGVKTVFSTQTKNKKKDRFRANCPKTHVQGCVDPNSRRKRGKEQNTKRREGSFKRSLFKFAKTVSKEEPRKTRKNHPHRSRKQISGNGPTRTQTAAQLRAENAPKISHKLVPAREKWEKRHFQNVLSSAAPGRFWFPNPIWSKIWASDKKKICETPKNDSQTFCAASRRYNGSNASERGTTTQNCSETPCFQVFRVLLPLGLCLEDPRPETRAKNENFFGPQKRTSTTSKMAFLKNPKNPKTVRKLDFRKPQKNRFRATKTVVSKRGGRKWTLGGPQMNARDPFWGAANEPSSIYIYIYISNP